MQRDSIPGLPPLRTWAPINDRPADKPQEQDSIMTKYLHNITESERAIERGDHRLAQIHLNSAARQMRQHRAMIAESMRRTRERRPWLDEA